MPHLMNCPHVDSGWCGACVAVLGEQSLEFERERDALLAEQLAQGDTFDKLVEDIKAAGHRFPVCAYCQTPHIVSDGSMARHVAQCERNPLVRRIGLAGALEMVAEFHRKHSQPVLDEVATCDVMAERAILRQSLVNEEAGELAEALGLVVPTIGPMKQVTPADVVKVADALADLAYVVIGTALEFGIPLDRVFAEVHRSNMTKTPGNVRGDGKILKGPDYSPPNLPAVLWPYLGDSKPSPPAVDAVNHPGHYKAAGLECIDVIEALGLNFHLGNVLKYLWRAGRKFKTATVEDLKKARWYLDREIARREAKESGR